MMLESPRIRAFAYAARACTAWAVASWLDPGSHKGQIEREGDGPALLSVVVAWKRSEIRMFCLYSGSATQMNAWRVRVGNETVNQPDKIIEPKL